VESHPRIRPLRDKAFRLVIEALGWCRQYLTNGIIPGSMWRTMQTKRAREELVAAGLAVVVDDDDVDMSALFHEWQQQTREDSVKARTEKSEEGARSAHRRWHVARGRTSPDCAYCVQPDGPTVEPKAGPIGSPMGHPSPDLSTDLCPPNGSSMQETETEVEREVTADHHRHLPVVDAREDDDDHQSHDHLEGLITATMAAATGDKVRLTMAEARRARILMLAGRTDPNDPRYVYSPANYVVSSIRKDPYAILAEIRRRPSEQMTGHADEMWMVRPESCDECGGTGLIDHADDRTRWCPKCKPHLVTPTPSDAVPVG
jgi:predicted Zn-ribbon and HTH transcriptional regulator